MTWISFFYLLCMSFEYAGHLVTFGDKTPSLNSGILDQRISVERDHSIVALPTQPGL